MFTEVATIYQSNFVFYRSIRNCYRDMSRNWNSITKIETDYFKWENILLDTFHSR